MNIKNEAKKILKGTKNLQESEIELLKTCKKSGFDENTIILDYDEDDVEPYYGNYIIFGNGVEPYRSINAYKQTLEEVIFHIDLKLEEYKQLNRLLLTMEDVYDSNDFTFYASKNDFGDINLKYKDTVINLGITPDTKEFYIKEATRIKNFLPPYSYEGLEENEDDWKYAVYFSKYTAENSFTNESFVDYLINLFLSENDECVWLSLLPKGYICSSNYVKDFELLTFKNKKSLLKSLNNICESLKNMKYQGED